MRCEQVRKHLSAYLDRELTAELAAAVRGHLASCPACRRLLDELRGTADLLGRLPVREPPADLADDVMREVERRMLAPPTGVEPTMPERTLALDRTRLWPRVLAVAACVALAAGIGLLAFFGSRPHEPPAAPGPESGLALGPESSPALRTDAHAYGDFAREKAAHGEGHRARAKGVPPADLAWGFEAEEAPPYQTDLYRLDGLLADADKAAVPDQPDLPLDLALKDANGRGGDFLGDLEEKPDLLGETWEAAAILHRKHEEERGEDTRLAVTRGLGRPSDLEAYGLPESHDWKEGGVSDLTINGAVAAGEPTDRLAGLGDLGALATGTLGVTTQDAGGGAETDGAAGRHARFVAGTTGAVHDVPKETTATIAKRGALKETGPATDTVAGIPFGAAEPPRTEPPYGESAEPATERPPEAVAKAGPATLGKAPPAEGEAVAPQTLTEEAAGQQTATEIAAPEMVQITMNSVAVGKAPVESLRRVATPSNLDRAPNQLNVRTTSRAAANRELVRAFDRNGWTSLDEMSREEDRAWKKRARAAPAGARGGQAADGVYYLAHRNGEDIWVVLTTVDDLSRFATQVAQSRTMQVEADSSQPFQAVRHLQEQLAAFEAKQRPGERYFAKAGRGAGGAGGGAAEAKATNGLGRSSLDEAEERGRRRADEDEAKTAEFADRVALAEKPAGPAAPAEGPEASAMAGQTKAGEAVAKDEEDAEPRAKPPAWEAEPRPRQARRPDVSEGLQSKAPPVEKALPVEKAPARQAMPGGAARPHIAFRGRVPPNQVMLIVRVRASAEPPHAAIPEAGQTEAEPARAKPAEERQTAPQE